MRIILILILISSCIRLLAQEDRKLIREGNSKYDDKKFNDSELLYRKALEKDPNSFKAGFNLGDALYRQGKYEEASNQFQALGNKDVNKEDLAKVYHNLGNTYLQNKKYKESIEAYKQSLRYDSDDMDTKYNLSYALRMLQQQQQQQQNQNQDQNKDQQKQDKQQQQQNQNQDQNKDQQKQDEQQQQQQQEQKISKEQSEQMLKSVENDEKKLKEKLEKQQVQPRKTDIEKDW